MDTRTDAPQKRSPSIAAPSSLADHYARVLNEHASVSYTPSMSSIAIPLSDSELDQLADFLESLPSPEAMNIERLDGFFCALVVGPELVMPGEYLAVRDRR